ncbi:DUF1501 domain-containing protein [Fimbriimonas ginsengisoli]|nr:DUF1501 domain-containing protein [Fimbriimonas ginsengisoli]
MAITDWQTCDGAGLAPGRRDEAAVGVSRRGLMVGLSIGLMGWATRQSALAQVSVGPRNADRNVVVVVFLRGGADGLSLLVPYADDTYYRLRPVLSVPKEKVHRLDGFFGLHPSLASLEPLFHSGQLAPLHAVGSDDQTRSHFEAMNTMERGVARRDGPQSGWVTRYLEASEPENPSPLRAVALGYTTPTSLVGATNATTLSSLSDYRLDAPESARHSLESMYGRGSDLVSHAGRETLDVLRTMERIDAAHYKPSNSAKYPDSDLGLGLKQVACLVRANVGLEVACLDKGGWDTHFGQGVTAGLLPLLLDDLGKSLAAFAQDLGPESTRVTTIVMTEFGRRIEENASLGTDHGHGSAMFLMGGGVRGGQVHAKWPGLDHPVGPGDLAVTTDYRDVLSEVLSSRMGLRNPSDVFAGYEGSKLGIVGA